MDSILVIKDCADYEVYAVLVFNNAEDRTKAINIMREVRDSIDDLGWTMEDMWEALFDNDIEYDYYKDERDIVEFLI